MVFKYCTSDTYSSNGDAAGVGTLFYAVAQSACPVTRTLDPYMVIMSSIQIKWYLYQLVDYPY